MDRGSQDSGSSRDGDKKVRIRLKTDPPKDPRSIKAPKIKSAMKKDDVPGHTKPEEHQEPSIQRTSSEDKGHFSTSDNVTLELKSQEVQPPELKETNNEMDKKSSQFTNSDITKGNDIKADQVERAMIDEKKEDDDGKERAEGNELPPPLDGMKVTTDSMKDERNSGDDPTSILLPSSQITIRANSDTQQSTLPFSGETEMAKEDAGNSANTASANSTPITELTDNEFQNPTSPRNDEEQEDPLPDAGLNDLLLNENDTLSGKEDPLIDSRSSKTEGGSKTNIGNPELVTDDAFQNPISPRDDEEQEDPLPDAGLNDLILNENGTLGEKEDPLIDSRSSKTEGDSKINIGNAELVTENVDVNKDMKKISKGSITRQSIETLITKDDQSKKNSAESNEYANYDKPESYFKSDDWRVEDTNEFSTTGADDGDLINTEGMKDPSMDKESSATTATTNDNISQIEASKTQTDSEIQDENENEELEEETTMTKQNEPSLDKADVRDKGIRNDDNISEHVKEEDGEDDPGKREGEDIPVLLKRTTGSEDLKIAELKNRVRPGQVFIVRGETDSFTVKWAGKRKVLAYKVGSKNTSRFSSVLIDTIEQLERASERRPSILSQFTSTSQGTPRRSILSTYLAGSNIRRDIRDHLIRDAGTNPDHQSGFTAKNNPPDRTLSATDLISPDKEVFGGAEQVQTMTGDAAYQKIDYNFPFLTDYDVNHTRGAKK